MGIILYSTGCPRCTVLEQKLERKNIPYKVINSIEIMIEKGFTTVPILDVDGNIMDFSEANAWVNSK